MANDINIKINEATDQQLKELSKKRKGENAMIRTKVDILSEAVDRVYKKEIKK
jgi:hypothetical protein